MGQPIQGNVISEGTISKLFLICKMSEVLILDEVFGKRVQCGNFAQQILT